MKKAYTNIRLQWGGQNSLNPYKIRKNNNIISLLNLLFIFVIVCFVTVVYSSFNTEMIITGEAILRVEENIRVTNIKVVEQTNDAYETYNNKYDKERTSLFVTLPNINSSITYQVTITNNSNTSYDVSDIVIENYSNTSIKYDIDLSIGNVIEANTSKTFTIRFYYDNTTLPNDITNTLIVKYDFVEHVNTHVIAIFDYEKKEETFVVPYTGIYKLEIWGAQGGSYNETYQGGYGGYATGIIQLDELETLYVNVGGSPVNNTNLNLNIQGGYNGGGGTGARSDLIDNAGGGATSIAYKSGKLQELENYKDDVIIVAGGGGGVQYTPTYYQNRSSTAGHGGGYKGTSATTMCGANCDCESIGTGGEQEKGGYRIIVKYLTELNNYDPNMSHGTFGLGSSGDSMPMIRPMYNQVGGSGGGGGYYGGSGNSCVGAGGGGSGYIGNQKLTERHMTCYNCETANQANIKTNTTLNVSNNAVSDYAKKGHGYAKITFIERIFK